MLPKGHGQGITIYSAQTSLGATEEDESGMPPVIKALAQTVAQMAQTFFKVKNTIGQVVQTQEGMQKSLTEVQQAVVALASGGRHQGRLN